jgi:hypothetical protein
MVCRKNVKDLTPQEKQDFVNAVKALKANGKYNQYVKQHIDAMLKATPPSVPSSVRNAAHRGPAFLPWHREFLRRFEQDLLSEVPGVALHYWDWASDAALGDPATAPVWGNDLMGGDGDASDNDYVKTGPFAYDPSDPNSWTIADEDGNDTGDGLQREFGVNVATLPTQAHVNAIQALTPYDASPWNTSSGGYRNANEGWATVDGNFPPNTHNRVHVWVGGSMLPGTSPNDPVFFLHHCFVDKLWADWQAQHPGEAYVPDPTESADLDGHRLNDAMYPWSTTPADVLNHRDLGYMYDTDALEVDLDTLSLVFNDVPEGETTVRAAVFSVSACEEIHLEIISGPTVSSGPVGTTFGTPLGTTETVPPGIDKGRVWISYTGTNDGDTATGTVTIRCTETAQEWVIPISANTIERPTVAAVLVLDQSGSMDNDAGDGRKRIDVLKESAPVFVDLLREDDGIGVVRFDHDAYPGTPIDLAGPIPFGAGRTAAKGAISGHMVNPAGYTSIGDGIDLAHTELSGPSAAGYDERAIIVLTDGKENRSLYIADIASIIDNRVFGIGLGTAEHINPAALTALTNGTGGYVLMTGLLDTDDYFILQKYYLQILAGVTNADIVLDPEGWLKPGQKHRIPFRLNETDITTDVILLTADVPPNTFQFAVETPSGALIDPSTASGTPGTTYAVGSNALFYRITLPVPVAGHEERAGTWHAVLTLDEKYYRRYLASLDNYPEVFSRVETHGIRYNLNVHTTSNLRMRARLIQDSQEPGATLALRAVLEEYGLPVGNRAMVEAELVRPDDTTALLSLSEVEPGVFEAGTVASLSGIYRFHVLASGRTLRNRPFTREQVLTGAVWQGGDEPLPTTENDPRERKERLCRLLTCFLSQRAIGGFLEERGLDVDTIQKCLKVFCEDTHGRPEGTAAAELSPEIKTLASRILAEPRLLEAFSQIVRESSKRI